MELSRLSAAEGVLDDWQDGGKRRAFRRRLVGWYRRNARDLPWRRTGDAYAVWVSETMLQQTQAATVGPYYERFLSRFPTVEALATADEHEVLRLWEGLGYYRRARQLHAAAGRVVGEHGGVFPRELAQAAALPGIGRYTAGAVLSIAYDARTPILEANTVRLWTRLLAWRGDVGSAAGQKVLWRAAEMVLPRRGSGEINQALMELGSQVCKPQGPDCAACPVRSYCRAFELGVQGSLPASGRKQRFEEVRQGVVVVWRGTKVLLVRRGGKERYAGLWDFPRFEMAGGDLEQGGAGQQATKLEATKLEAAKLEAAKLEAAKLEAAKLDAAKLNEAASALAGSRVRVGRHLATLRHGVTRFKITLECFEARVEGGGAGRGGRRRGGYVATAVKKEGEEVGWFGAEEIRGLALNSTGRKIAERFVM